MPRVPYSIHGQFDEIALTSTVRTGLHIIYMELEGFGEHLRVLSGGRPAEPWPGFCVLGRPRSLPPGECLFRLAQ